MPEQTTKPGFVNRNGQVVIRNTGKPGTDHGQSVYQLACTECGHVYGANGSDVFERKCPRHQGGALGNAPWAMPGAMPHKRFYEKVIKVKADVAVLLNFLSDISIDVR